MSDIPTTGRLAGIDFGTVRIGIAITDPNRTIASPLENYSRGDPSSDQRRFQRLIEEEGIVGFVVGLPINTDGRETPKSREARAFGDWIASVTKLPVVYHDERFSTSIAHEIMIASNVKASKRKKHLDMIAAQQILQSYIEQ